MAQPEDNNINAMGSILMLVCLVAALVLANTTDWYSSLVSHTIDLPIIGVTKSLKSFSKDVLMVLFFLYVGMELRYESVKGSLSSKRQVMLPLCSALGGVIIPSLIYLAINFNHPENYRGFGIPCATDIAFALCLFNIMSKHMPPSARAFLLAIAIFDDIIAIIIIALFYTDNINPVWVMLSLSPFVFLCIAYMKNITNHFVYIVLLILLYFCFYKAGINSTLSGFLVGFLTPFSTKSGQAYLIPIMSKLQPFVQFLVLPIFVFASTGISFANFTVSSFLDPIVLGIALGLFFGKQLGITAFTYIAIKMNLAQLPLRSKMFDIYTIASVAGIGFTMSLFIGALAFNEVDKQNLVKTGVVSGSIICALFSVLIVLVLRKKPPNQLLINISR